MIITAKYINDHKTSKGGWTRKQVEALGGSWPPKRGWKREIIGNEISDSDAKIFESGKDDYASNNACNKKLRSSIDIICKNVSSLTDIQIRTILNAISERL